VLQDVLRRLDKAFKAFFRRVKSGEVPGYPRFKAWFRYNSLTYPQSGFGIEPCGPAPQGKNRQAKQWAKLTLAKIGTIWMNMHRPLKGVIKTCTIIRSSTGKWYVSFSCDEIEPEPPPESDEEVGIDVGLKTFAYLSTGEQIENPRFFRAHQALRVYCRGSINGSQHGKKPPTFEIHRRCGMVVVLHTPHLESGGGCKVRGEGSTGLYVANLLCVWA
jgi:putative transposase